MMMMLMTMMKKIIVMIISDDSDHEDDDHMMMMEPHLPIPVRLVHILSSQLLLERVSAFEAKELVQIEQDIEQNT